MVQLWILTIRTSTYDTFLDAMETFFAPESGNSGDKLVLASRKVIGWFNKLGDWFISWKYCWCFSIQNGCSECKRCFWS